MLTALITAARMSLLGSRLFSPRLFFSEVCRMVDRSRELEAPPWAQRKEPEI